MILWRVSNHVRLDGVGGLSAPGRWHTVGQRVAYCAPNPATALLEVLVHAEIEMEDLPLTFQYLEIEAPDKLAVEVVDANVLGQTWRRDLAVSRQTGDQWLRAGETPLLRVPSVLVPATWNVLINPKHPDSAQVRVALVHSHVIDRRLL